MSDLVNRALVFATTAHAGIGQVRRYTDEPYIVHPIEVMMLVRTAAIYDDEMLAAALLHDVVEDTPATDADVRTAFGNDVGNLVQELTEPLVGGNRAFRKGVEREKLASISARGQTVKIADLISNSRTILVRDPNFARVYQPEKVALLHVLTRGDGGLLAAAWDLVPVGLRTEVPATAPEHPAAG